MNKTLKELAELVGGQLEGPPDLVVKGVNPPGEAGPADLTFIFNKNKEKLAASTKALAIVVPQNFPSINKPVIKVVYPKIALAEILTLFEPKYSSDWEIHPTAQISPKVKKGRGISVGPYCFIEEGVSLGDGCVLVANIYLGKNVSIGSKTKIYPGCVIYYNVAIGSRTIIHSNTTIGSDGFGYVTHSKKQIKIPQIGGVIIGDDVEIGANVAIDRATMGATEIGSGTKIDNLVQIAHNVKIGKNCLIAGQTGIAGSVEIGDNVVMGGQVAVAEHVKIGPEGIVSGRAAVSKDIPAGLVVSGFPAQEFHKEMRFKAMLRKVPQLYEKIKKIEQKLTEKK